MAAGVSVCILIAGILTSLPANGQFTGSHAPEKISRGEPANVFASWEGRTAVGGFVIQLPPDWVLEEVSVLERSFHSVPLSLRSRDDGRLEVIFENPLQSGGEIVLRVRGDDAYASDRLLLTPFAFSAGTGRPQMMEADRLSIDLQSDRMYTDPENRVLSFAGSDVHPLIFRSGSVPSLDLHRAFSASFWMKATGLNEVIFSTWNGDENVGYPLEMIVGPAGRLRCFRGRPGLHQSIGSKKPVADGVWHHVVLVNDPGAGWMRLQIDGQPVDSLYSATPPLITMQLPPALGGRVPGSNPYFDGMTPYSGFIDAVDIRHLSEPGPHSADPLELDLDSRLPEDLLVEPPRGVRLIRSDLSFRPAVDHFNAVHENGVVILRWTARSVPSREFVIERSKDGHQFEVVHQVRTSSPSGDYEYRDVGAGNAVAFYRLRQTFADGAERISATIKIGMGEDHPEPITLVGNFPNPFNNTTTISYVVKEQVHVGLSVWDVSGQSVGRLVDRTQSPGFYEVQFEAGELPSGTYFVRLQGQGGTKSHKMILMK